MTAETCPHCGQVIAPDLVLPGHYGVIYRALRRGPLGPHALIDLMYRDLPAPDSARRVLYVTISELNVRLKPYGIEVRSFGKGKGEDGTYRFIRRQMGRQLVTAVSQRDFPRVAT